MEFKCAGKCHPEETDIQAQLQSITDGPSSDLSPRLNGSLEDHHLEEAGGLAKGNLFNTSGQISRSHTARQYIISDCLMEAE